MRYYVLGENGERYGPADVPTLAQWARERRLSSASKLMDEMTGSVVDARSVPGIVFPQAAPPAPMAPMTPIPPGSPSLTCGPMQPMPPQPGYSWSGPNYMPKIAGADPKKDLLLSFGMVLLSPVLSLFCIYGMTAALLGIGAGVRAFQNGSKIALLAIILNVGSLVFWALAKFVFRWWLLDHY